jgi:hypothetical protein
VLCRPSSTSSAMTATAQVPAASIVRMLLTATHVQQPTITHPNVQSVPHHWLWRWSIRLHASASVVHRESNGLSVHQCITPLPSCCRCAESPWVLQRSDLPAQQYLWPAPPAGADPGTPAQGKCRKVRSTQQLAACVPGAAAHAACCWLAHF